MITKYANEYIAKIILFGCLGWIGVDIYQIIIDFDHRGLDHREDCRMIIKESEK